MREWSDILPAMLRQAGIEAALDRVEPMTGGVSSDIVAVHLADGQMYCAKRALPTLKVSMHWQAPVERSRYEAAWLRKAGEVVPDAVPRVLAEDMDSNALLMEYLPSADYALWKVELLAGRFDPRAVHTVSASLARIHAATWGDAAVARAFATDAMFDALRLDPYLRTLVRRLPDLAAAIERVIDTTAQTRLALVHGDVSPKNILLARSGDRAVLLDAECAWFGDPAFDAAFCVNHLLLKAVHVPAIRDAAFSGASAFLIGWLAGLPGDARLGAEQRVLRLLPCLLLARVEGKSPVEYLTPGERDLIRGVVPPMILSPPSALSQIVGRLSHALRASI